MRRKRRALVRIFYNQMIIARDSLPECPRGGIFFFLAKGPEKFFLKNKILVRVERLERRNTRREKKQRRDQRDDSAPTRLFFHQSNPSPISLKPPIQNSMAVIDGLQNN